EGDQATEAAVKQAAPGHRVIHFATHGFVLNQGLAPADPASRGVGVVEAAPISSVSVPVDPLLLAGLALAGANHRGRDEGAEDGILTAAEIASMDLAGTDWAVLSACKSGLGVVSRGEGVLGLRRAFEIAGCHTVIASLWAVGDQATREWMD